MMKCAKSGGYRRALLWSLVFMLVLSLTMSAALAVADRQRGAAAEIFRNEQIDGILCKRMDLDNFESAEELDAWSKGAAVDHIELVAEVLGTQYVAEGSQCLEVTRDGVSPVTTAAVFTRSFATPIDLTEAPVLAFAVNAYGGCPGADKYFLTVTARSGKQAFSSKFIFAPGAWNTLTMNLSECPFLSEIGALEFAFGNNSTKDRATWTGRLQLDHFFAGQVIDMKFGEAGNTQGFTAAGADLTAADDALNAAVTDAAAFSLTSPAAPYNLRVGALYGEIKTKNTIYAVVANNTSATQMNIAFVNGDDDEFSASQSKTVEIAPNSGKRLYRFDFADVAGWNSSVRRFRITLPGFAGTGTLSVDSLSFQLEDADYDYAGKVERLVVSPDKSKLSVSGWIDEEVFARNPGAELRVYPVYPHVPDSEILAQKCLWKKPLGELSVAEGRAAFAAEDLNFMQNETKTLTDADLVVVLVRPDNTFVQVDERRGLDNWEDFLDGKYRFETRDVTFDVLEYGAKGDGFSDDTGAVQAAIDAATADGGGRVLLGGGRTYIGTNIILKDNVTLYIETGSVLRQSDDIRDYPYEVELGHESKAFAHINWCVTQLVSNPPLVQANGAKNVKVTGGGEIRMSDTENTGDNLMPNAEGLVIQYQACAQRIHIVPIGLYSCTNVEVSNLTITRNSGYHCCLYYSENVTVANLRIGDVKCVGSDGVALKGVNKAVVFRVSVSGNDDGITISSSYEEPRGILWFWSKPGEYQAPRDIEVSSSYISSGGGKAISVITWGSSDPNPELQEIDNVSVTDCTLRGGYSVGTWADNPYNGKFPYDNTELDDFSAVKNIYIWNNNYMSPCSLDPNIVTNAVTDCGIESAERFVNADFDDGLLYWSKSRQKASVLTLKGDKVGALTDLDGETTAELYQGLYLKAGEYLVKAHLKADGTGFQFFVRRALDGHMVKSVLLPKSDWQYRYLYVVVESSGTYQIGIRGQEAEGSAYADTFSLSGSAFGSGEGVVQSQLFSECDVLPEGYVYSGSTWTIDQEESNSYLTQESSSISAKMTTRYDGYVDTELSARVRFNGWADSDNNVSFSFRKRNGSYYLVYFSQFRDLIGIRKDEPGRETSLSAIRFNLDNHVWYDVKMQVYDENAGVRIKLFVDGAEILNALDADGLKTGACEIGNYYASASFDDIFLINYLVEGETEQFFTVADGAAQPVVGAVVRLYRSGVSAGEAVTDAYGKVTFRLTDLTAQYTYTVDAYGYRSVSPTGLVPGAAEDVTLTADAPDVIETFADLNRWKGVSATYRTENGSLVQDSFGGSRADLIAAPVDFELDYAVTLSGFENVASSSVRMMIFKGDKVFRIEYSPVFQYVALYDKAEGAGALGDWSDASLQAVGNTVRVRIVFAGDSVAYYVNDRPFYSGTFDGMAGQPAHIYQTSSSAKYAMSRFALIASDSAWFRIADGKGRAVPGAAVRFFDEAGAALTTVYADDAGFARAPAGAARYAVAGGKGYAGRWQIADIPFAYNEIVLDNAGFWFSAQDDLRDHFDFESEGAAGFALENDTISLPAGSEIGGDAHTLPGRMAVYNRFELRFRLILDAVGEGAERYVRLEMGGAYFLYDRKEGFFALVSKTDESVRAVCDTSVPDGTNVLIRILSDGKEVQMEVDGTALPAIAAPMEPAALTWAAVGTAFRIQELRVSAFAGFDDAAGTEQKTDVYTTELFEQFDVDCPAFTGGADGVANAISFADDKITVTLSRDSDAASAAYDVTAASAKRYGDFELTFRLTYFSTDHTGTRFLMLTFGDGYTFNFMPWEAKVFLQKGNDMYSHTTSLGSLPMDDSVSSQGIDVKVVVKDGKIAMYVGGTQIGTAQDYAPAETGFLLKARRVKAEISNFQVTYYKLIDSCRVAFLAPDGSVLDVQDVAAGQGATAPDTSSIAGFAGWDTAFDSVTGDLVVRALTRPAGYTVTFLDAEGNVLRSVWTKAGATIGEIPELALGQGLTHVGWLDEQGKPVDLFAVREDVTVRPKLERDKAKVVFVGRDGAVIAARFVVRGQAAAAPDAPEVTGYVFTGWDRDFSAVERDLVVYANYERTKVIVTFLGADGDVIAEREADYEGYVLPPEAAAPAGKVFVGWDGPLYGFTGPVTLRAVFAEASFEVVFYDFEGNLLKREEVALGGSATAPVIEDPGDYVFKGWSADFTNVTGYTEVNALFRSPDLVEITFIDSLGDTVVLECSKTQANAGPDLHHDGYVLVGWFTDPAFTSPFDLAADRFTGPTTLYAKWAKLFRVTYSANEGGSVGAAGTVAKGSSYALDIRPDDGYVVKSVKVNGAELAPTDGKYVVANVSADLAVEVVFAKAGGCAGCGGTASAAVLALLAVAALFGLRRH